MKMKDFVYKCTGCDKTYPGPGPLFRCKLCGEPLEVVFEGNKTIPKNGLSEQTMIERYCSFYPFDKPATGLSLGEGFTPLVESQGFAEKYGPGKIFFKNESANPTWSFKDRGSLTGIMHALETGYRAIGTVSTGNMAASVAAYGARAGIETFILVKNNLPEEKINPIAVYGAKVIKVNGDYGQLYYDSLEAGGELGIYFINSDSPFRVEGSKTIAFEIFEQMGREVPDHVIVPTSAGGNIRGIFKGFRELKDAGFADKIPTIICAQAEGCSPIAEAWKKGKRTIERIDNPETIAHAIENPFPPSGNEVLRMLKSPGGFCVSLSDEEILEAQKNLAGEGMFVQPASATTLAAIQKLQKDSYWIGSEKIVSILTGGGLKYTSVFEKMSLQTYSCSLKELKGQLQGMQN